MLNINIKSVYRTLKAKGKSSRTMSQAAMRYTDNTSFFNNINCEKKAYWLGVLYADGNVSTIKKGSGQVFLTSSDKEWVESFLKDLDSNRMCHKETHLPIWPLSRKMAQPGTPPFPFSLSLSVPLLLTKESTKPIRPGSGATPFFCAFLSMQPHHTTPCQITEDLRPSQVGWRAFPQPFHCGSQITASLACVFRLL